MSLSFTEIMYLLMIIFQSILALILMYKAYKRKVKNLWILSLASVAQALVFVNFFFHLRTIVIIYYYSMILISYLIAVAFIHQTFYKGRRSGVSIILISSNIANIILIVLVYIDPPPFLNLPFISPHLYVWSTAFIPAIPNFWCAYTLLKEFFRYKNNKNIYPWLKMRYLMAGSGHLIFSTTGIGPLIWIYFDLFEFGVYWLIFTHYAFTIISFIAWTMPKPFKEFLNRNYEPIKEKELSEEEIMSLLKGD